MIHYHWVTERLREGFSHWVYISKLNVPSAYLLRPNGRGGLCPHCCPFLLSKTKWLLPNCLFGIVNLCCFLSWAWEVCIVWLSHCPDLNGPKSILKIKPSGEESSHAWKESQILFDLPVWAQVKRKNFAENTTILSASTNIVLETILEAHLKLQGWIITASFENMESCTNDQVTNGHTQKQGKNLFKMSIQFVG